MKVRLRRMLSAILLCGLAAVLGCSGFFVYPGSTSGSGSASSNGDYVYIANATTDTLTGFGVSSGALSAIASSPYALSFSPTAVVITPQYSLLYVGGAGAIYAYSIGTGGVLTALNGGSYVAVANVAAMAVAPDGQWLFCLDANGTTVEEYQIDTSTGVLTQGSGATYAVGGTVIPKAITVSPNGNFVIAALGTGGDIVFTFNESTGALAGSQELSEPTTTTSDNALAIDPTSTYLYIARSGTYSGVAVYTIAAANGALTTINGSPFNAGTQPYSIVINSAGTDLYVANRSDGTISGYSVASGVLTPLTGSPYTSGNAVTALAIDSSGDYLLAASNGGSPDLTLYTFDTTTPGKLDLTTATTTGTDPTNPVAIAATP